MYCLCNTYCVCNMCMAYATRCLRIPFRSSRAAGRTGRHAAPCALRRRRAGGAGPAPVMRVTACGTERATTPGTPCSLRRERAGSAGPAPASRHKSHTRHAPRRVQRLCRERREALHSAPRGSGHCLRRPADSVHPRSSDRTAGGSARADGPCRSAVVDPGAGSAPPPPGRCGPTSRGSSRSPATGNLPPPPPDWEAGGGVRAEPL